MEILRNILQNTEDYEKQTSAYSKFYFLYNENNQTGSRTQAGLPLNHGHLRQGHTLTEK